MNERKQRYPDYEAIIDWHDGTSDELHEHDDTIHVSEPVFLGREREYLLDCIHRRWLSQGRYVGRLERGFAEFTGSAFGVACSSGTSALHLAMLAVGLEPGDVVLVPSLSYIATANCVSYCGATPIFCEVDPKTWCLDPNDVQRKVARLRSTTGRGPVGVIATHLFDAVADLDGIKKAMPDDSWLVEDACQAHGATYGERMAGSVGDIGVFSFYGSKTITAGEGGMLVTDNQVRADVARLFRGQGALRAGHYEHNVIGYNYRMTDLSAAIAVAQLETVEKHLVIRRHAAQLYRTLLNDVAQCQGWYQNTVGGTWALGIILPPGKVVEIVRERMLVDSKVETRPFFVPIHQTVAYRDEHGVVNLPQTSQLANRGMVLPLHSMMTEEKVRAVVDALKAALS